MINKKLINTGVAAPAPIDPLQNFETVTYTGNGGTQKITGYIRKGAAFSTNGTYVSLPSNFNLANNSFTISAWFANTKTSANSYGITSSGSGSSCHTNLHIGRRGSNGKFAFAFFCSDLDSSTNMSTDGTWQHWVCTYDASNNSRKIYLNGTLDASDTASNDYIGTANLQLGGDTYWGTGNEYQGKLDQVRIFDKALDSGEVGQLADETYADPKKSTTDYFEDGSGVALYELDEDANDTGLPIDSGQSAVFDGSSSYINTNSSLLANTTWSVSLWFNTNDVTNNQALFSQYVGGDGTRFFVWVYNSGTQIRITLANNDYFNNFSISNNTWHHLVITKDSNGFSTYLDNGTAVTNTNTTSMASSTIDFEIGAQSGGIYNHFNGKIDQVRVYSSKLSSSDVTNLYNESNVPTANLLAHYKLDGDATDETTNYNATWGGTEAYSDPAIRTYKGTPTNVNFLGMAFQPDFVWLKDRGTTYHHILQDSVRGVNSKLASDGTYEENNSAEISLSYGQITSFDSNGFTLGNGTTQTNTNGNSYVAWCWKAGGAASLNEEGSIDSQVSANQDAGFSIVKWAGSDANDTVGHGLSVPPELIIVKNIAQSTGKWATYNHTIGSTKTLYLNESAGEETNGFWQNTSPTSDVFYVSGQDTVNGPQGDIIAYCFHSVDGYQKVGSYTGTGAAGNNIDVGFRPRWVMVKIASDSTAGWVIVDSTRDTSDPRDSILAANLNYSESTLSVTNRGLNFDDNGFEPVFSGSASVENNKLDETYIYLAIA